ncbi:adenine phosphoribosyltransferase [Tilletia horrida]|uniref:adenine phosphoribosyltransferase n=1 Tax=Tilletia horrida TaxID=155126 RepID=A0AAN6JYZ7_9BASI|nr:adenine phosphoribosyltransferase [Tilletia horrida]KAK0553740.1 adenine phosphoribosyltransferase [Tilletia horrida]KAK0567634.1 adenine phosphoribosyltransferase [Tilletia horrida]
MSDIELIKKHFQYHKDFPTPGILFCDILPVLRDPLAFEALLTHILTHIFTHTFTLLPPNSGSGKIDAVVGLDARGFLFGPILALRLGASFVPVRKRGKLPGECVQAKYAKEYGEDVFEMQAGALKPGANVLVVDDLIATGGSAKAAGELVAKLGAKTVEYIFVVAIPFLKGAEKLNAPSYALVNMD